MYIPLRLPLKVSLSLWKLHYTEFIMIGAFELLFPVLDLISDIFSRCPSCNEQGPFQECCRLSGFVMTFMCICMYYGSDVVVLKKPFSCDVSCNVLLCIVTSPPLLHLVNGQCSLPLDLSTCGRRTTKWHFDRSRQKCMRFLWGGCAPATLANRFDSEEECLRKCTRQSDSPRRSRRRKKNRKPKKKDNATSGRWGWLSYA